MSDNAMHVGICGNTAIGALPDQNATALAGGDELSTVLINNVIMPSLEATVSADPAITGSRVADGASVDSIEVPDTSLVSRLRFGGMDPHWYGVYGEDRGASASYSGTDVASVAVGNKLTAPAGTFTPFAAGGQGTKIKLTRDGLAPITGDFRPVIKSVSADGSELELFPDGEHGITLTDVAAGDTVTLDHAGFQKVGKKAYAWMVESMVEGQDRFLAGRYMMSSHSLPVQAETALEETIELVGADWASSAPTTHGGGSNIAATTNPTFAAPSAADPNGSVQNFAIGDKKDSDGLCWSEFTHTATNEVIDGTAATRSCRAFGDVTIEWSATLFLDKLLVGSGPGNGLQLYDAAVANNGLLVTTVAYDLVQGANGYGFYYGNLQLTSVLDDPARNDATTNTLSGNAYDDGSGQACVITFFDNL